MSVLVWHFPHDKAIHYDADGEEVGLVAIPTFVQHLRSHVAQRATIAEKSLVLTQVFADSEVYYLDVHVFIKHDILGFYVLVNYFIVVNVLERLENAAY